MFEHFYRKWVYGQHPVHSNDWTDPLHTTTCLTGVTKEYTLIYSPNLFNMSWQKKNSGYGLLRTTCHKSVSLQRVFPEMGCPTLSKFYTGTILPIFCWSAIVGGKQSNTFLFKSSSMQCIWSLILSRSALNIFAPWT